MQLIDSHSHLDFSDFDQDRSEAIKRAMSVGVSDIIVSSTTAERWKLVKKVCEENPQICHAAYGLHPMFMNEHNIGISSDAYSAKSIEAKTENKNDIQQLKSWLENNNAVAVGEIGLDFFISEADEKNRKFQLELFISQLEIADEFDLPIIIHARKSLDIVLKYLRRFPRLRGSIHSFSGSIQQANQLIDLGFYLSFGGPITYSRATRLHQLLKDLPLDALLVETDAPDQPDSEHYLQRNEPAFITHVIEKIAELKQLDVELVAKHTTENAIELFNFYPT